MEELKTLLAFIELQKAILSNLEAQASCLRIQIPADMDPATPPTSTEADRPALPNRTL